MDESLANYYLSTRGKDGIIPMSEQSRMLANQLGLSKDTIRRGQTPDYDINMFLQRSGYEPQSRTLIATDGAHFDDIGKLPNHPTFSDGSAYHNTQQQGGHWQDLGTEERSQWLFTPSKQQLANKEGMENTMQYLARGNTYPLHPDDIAYVDRGRGVEFPRYQLPVGDWQYTNRGR
jgi:hypothetical protein